jgi:hypothetical protein
MIRCFPALAMAALSIASAFAPSRAEVAAQPQSAVSETDFKASPITPGFWQFSNIRNASSDDIARGCREYVTFQFRDGHYFTLSMKKNAREPAESGLTAATVHEVGRCTFDPTSQSEHCDVAVTDDAGINHLGFIDIRYSTGNSSLKMSIKATITAGPDAGKTESFERFPVKCPDNIVYDLMTPTKR